MRWQNQAEFYKADSINLTAQLKEAQEKIVLLEKEVQKGKKEADGQDSDTEKAVELKKLQQTIDRQKLMMEYKEKEQKAAVMYAELQITELQKELLRVRLCTEEKWWNCAPTWSHLNISCSLLYSVNSSHNVLFENSQLSSINWEAN